MIKRLTLPIYKLSSLIKRKPILLALTLATSLHLFYKSHLKPQCFFETKSPLVDLLAKPIIIRSNSRKNEVEAIIYQLTQTIYAVFSPNTAIIPQNLSSLDLDYFSQQDLGIKFKRVIGKFDNMILIQSEKRQSNNILLGDNKAQLYDKVTVVDMTRAYPRMIDAHIVGSKTYAYILDTDNCKPGSLVIHNNRPLGIITSIPIGQFSRFVPFSALASIGSKIIGNKFNPHLGISVKDSDHGSGAFVVRINTTSPFANYIKLGDTITKVNKLDVGTSLDLLDLINVNSAENIEVTVIRDGRQHSLLVPNL